MNPDEFKLLTTFLTQLSQVSGVTKDPQAASLIGDAVARQPDAAYLLVQRALLQDQALNSARERIATLEAQVSATPAAPSAGFLDSGSNAWGRSAASAPMQSAPVAQAQYAAAPPQYAAAPGVAPRGGLFGGGGGGGSFLTSMAATAAGVAGGAFLFQGIESMMHHGNASRPLMDQQPNAFGGMANSVDNVNSTQAPAAAEPALSSDDNSGVDDVASNDDSGSSDDSYA